MTESVRKWVENGNQEIEVELFFDYTPAEPMTRHYPGCGEELTIYEAKLVGLTDENGRLIETRDEEICILPNHINFLEEEILDDRDEDMNASWDDYADYVHELRRDARL